MNFPEDDIACDQARALMGQPMLFPQWNYPLDMWLMGVDVAELSRSLMETRPLKAFRQGAT
jgi:hypothetical protein